MPLKLEPYESVFVVFRTPATATSRTILPAVERNLGTLPAAWTLRFPADSGVPLSVPAGIGSWTERSEPEARYFSGAATYEQEIRVPSRWIRNGERVLLDLGRVGDLAEVRINGKIAGTAWKPPYQVDVTDQLRAGPNQIEITVANTWQNRFVGDLQPGVEQRAWTNNAAEGGFPSLAGALNAKTPLTPSGLLEPVRVIGVRLGAAR